MEQLTITIPPFIDELVAAYGPTDTDEARMQLAIALSRRNVERGGGPFGAVVFDGPRVVAAGVNRVLDVGFSIAHAEIVALMRAQKALSGDGERSASGTLMLVTSTEPCCQCYGAVVWSGIDRLVCGADTDDAESIGFDEGPKPKLWAEELEKRGIAVTQGVCRVEARDVLAEYKRRGGEIYGLRHPAIKRG
ncbi:MAG TPA: nucleoside deaminase [Polyangiales bacterium]|jgi:tRNA(Arg) A34 adenosine deaminase TadA